MRVVILGAGTLAVAVAEILVKRGHEVVIIERDKERIDAVSEYLDCGFVHGDGSKPGILREVGPSENDLLLCLSGSDEDNIITSLVGRSLGFGRVVTKIEDTELEPICVELGLSDTIVPNRTIARDLANMAEGQSLFELSGLIKGELRIFSFVTDEEAEGPLAELELPPQTRVICIYRGEKFLFPEEDTRLSAGDEVVLATHNKNLPALRERWAKPARPTTGP